MSHCEILNFCVKHIQFYLPLSLIFLSDWAEIGNTNQLLFLSQNMFLHWIALCTKKKWVFFFLIMAAYSIFPTGRFRTQRQIERTTLFEFERLVRALCISV